MEINRFLAPVKNLKKFSKGDKMIKIDFEKMGGIIPVITQDYKTKEVLMLGFMNKEAYKKMLKTKKVTYWSRSRKKLWTKGETSGNFQLVKEIMIDCDNDTLLIKVEQIKAACHKGYKSCFFRKIDGKKIKIVSKRIFDPKEVYKNDLLLGLKSQVSLSRLNHDA